MAVSVMAVRIDNCPCFVSRAVLALQRVYTSVRRGLDLVNPLAFVPPGNRSVIRSRRQPMSVMSDRWIRQMATTQSMIEPFEEGHKRDGDHQLRPVQLWL